MIETGEWQLPDDAVATGWRAELRSAAREVWRFLPAWMFFIYGVGLLNTELTNLSPAREDLAWTIVFPVGVFLLFIAARATLAPDVRRRATMLAVCGGVALALPLALLLWHRPSPLSLDDLRAFYELSNFLWAGLLVAHAWRRHRSVALLFFGVAFLYGALLENGGIFLGFFHETNLPLTMVRPLVAPFATMVGWSVVLYMATFVVWHLRRWVPALQRSAALSALLVAAVATALDFQIDPLATAAGCWVWDASLPPWFLGVPRVNFVAWLCALAPFAYVMFRYQEREGLHDRDAWSRRHLLRLAALVPATLTVAAAAFMLCTVVLEGPQGPSWSLLHAFAQRVLTAAL